LSRLVGLKANVKQHMTHCRNSSTIHLKDRRKINTHRYTTAHCPGLVQTYQWK